MHVEREKKAKYGENEKKKKKKKKKRKKNVEGSAFQQHRNQTNQKKRDMTLEQDNRAFEQQQAIQQTITITRKNAHTYTHPSTDITSDKKSRAPCHRHEYMSKSIYMYFIT